MTCPVILRLSYGAAQEGAVSTWEGRQHRLSASCGQAGCVTSTQRLSMSSRWDRRVGQDNRVGFRSGLRSVTR